MNFRIADTFTDSLDSLARLTGDEQKLTKTTAFDLQLNPSNPGMQFHRLTKSKDPNFWSVRVGSDLRLIVHRTASSLMLCYVDHHDVAYSSAERRRIERHPQTGAAQLVEVRETVREIIIPRYVEAAPAAPPAADPAAAPAEHSAAAPAEHAAAAAAEHAAAALPGRLLFAEAPEWVFRSHCVPLDWMAAVRAATEETLFDGEEHLLRGQHNVKRLGRKTRLAESPRHWTGRGTRIVPRDSSGPASGMRVS